MGGGAEGCREAGEGIGGGRRDARAGPVEEVEEELGVEAVAAAADEARHGVGGEAGRYVGGGDGELPVAGAAREEGGHLCGHSVGVLRGGGGGRRSITCAGCEGGGRRRDWEEEARCGGSGPAASVRGGVHRI